MRERTYLVNFHYHSPYLPEYDEVIEVEASSKRMALWLAHDLGDYPHRLRKTTAKLKHRRLDIAPRQ